MKKSYFKELSFCFSWRPYQEKVLTNFSKHIYDNHFHIVAPPGSGKTVLGIEIIKKLNKKTLVLAPTLTIRNQWEDRLQNFFTKNCSFKNYSFDIKNPSDITFSTYQGLHTFFKSFKTEEAYFNFFKDHAIDVLVLDEAHHLKNEWWKCLYDLKKNYSKTIVALTATPPYDSEKKEIQKYFDLCGEIDDEIVVPDLIKEKNLCPHQDVIFLSKPEDYEINFIANFRLKISDFKSNLLKNTTFISFLKKHRFYTHTEKFIEEIYSLTEFFSAILIFLNETGNTIPFEKLEVLGFEKQREVEFPKLDNYWLEILLQHLLVIDRENLSLHEEYLNTIEKQLRKLSIFSNKKINFIGNELLYKSLSKSPSKLKSITSVVKYEKSILQDDLRCVILTDYIRKEYLNTSQDELNSINKLGVIPIFHHLKANNSIKTDIAVLSGTVVIIHRSVTDKLENIQYSSTELKCDTDFFIISPKSSNKNMIVSLLTHLFELGHIKILISTKALLGEGWDAPSINSLILASVVGSFVTSNQMRGRAIRVNPNNPNKVGIIWHLACIDTSDKNGGRDVDILSRRFNSFLGISNTNDSLISNGIERIDLPRLISEKNIDRINKNSFEIAKNRQAITTKWDKAVKKGKIISNQIKLFHQEDKNYTRQKKLYFTDIVKYIGSEIFISLCFFIPEYIIRNFDLFLYKGVLYFIYSLLSTLALIFGWKIYTLIKLYFRYGLIHKKVKKIAFVILDTMEELELLTTTKQEIKIATDLVEKGNVVVTILGTNRLESNLFINALNEILLPIQNPKYLLIKTNLFRRRLHLENFFPIPELFSNQKKNCLIFQKNWKNHISKSKICYTRNGEGRKLLLKARLFHIHNSNKKITQKNVIWM